MKFVEFLDYSDQVMWLDHLSRELLDDGELERLRDDMNVGGVTANPTIFEQAITDGDAYEDAIRSGDRNAVSDPETMFWDLAVSDIQRAADLFLPRYRDTDGRDGLVSLEVSPDLADDREGTVRAGRELFERLDRPNVMIKVPGTPAGVVAIEELTAVGVSVNVTLLFGLHQFEAAWTAYVNGLDRRRADGLGVSGVHSVASFFLSRIDVAGNELMPGDSQNELAIALARLAYDQWMTSQTLDKRWIDLRRSGAEAQRLLWASTSSKDPELAPTYYPERLVAPDTIVTVPPATLEALGGVDAVEQPRLDQKDVGYATHVIGTARNQGIDVDGLADDLQVAGVEKFATSWSSLLQSIADAATGSPAP